MKLIRSLRSDNFTVFLDDIFAKGKEHTILRYSRFYTTQQEGELFVDWFTQMIEGENPIPIDCRGENGHC